MARKRAIVDVDEVLFAYLDPFLKFLNNYYGQHFTRRHVARYELSRLFGVPLEEMKQRTIDFGAGHRLLALDTIPGAVKGMHDLLEFSDVDIATARADADREDTIGSLRLDYPNCFGQIYFTNGYHTNDSGITKAELCKDLAERYGQEVILVDDSYKFTRDYAELGGRSVLLDCPWNHGRHHDLITRVDNWPEIVETIRRM